jgi:hypothetical protein
MKGRDKNEPSGNKTGPDWIRIEVNQTTPRILPPQKSNRLALNQSETHLITLNQTEGPPTRPKLRGPSTPNLFHPIRPGQSPSFSVRSSMFPIRRSNSFTLDLRRARSCPIVPVQFSSLATHHPSPFRVPRSEFRVNPVCLKP